MEVLLRVVDGVVESAVVGGGIALAEVVGLGVRGVATHELPVNLVQVVGLEHDAADNTLARGGLHDDGDGAEEDVEV